MGGIVTPSTRRGDLGPRAHGAGVGCMKALAEFEALDKSYEGLFPDGCPMIATEKERAPVAHADAKKALAQAKILEQEFLLCQTLDRTMGPHTHQRILTFTATVAEQAGKGWREALHPKLVQEIEAALPQAEEFALAAKKGGKGAKGGGKKGAAAAIVAAPSAGGGSSAAAAPPTPPASVAGSAKGGGRGGRRPRGRQ